MEENKSYGFGTENQQETAQPDTFGTQTTEQSFGTPEGAQTFGAPTEDQTFGAPTDGQTFGAPTEAQTFGAPTEDQGFGAQPDGQAYGQSADQFGGQTYGQPNQQFGGQAYGQPNQQFGGQAYGQSADQFGGQTYGQPNQQFGGQAYGQPNYGMGAMPMDANGQPLKNTFGMKMTFSILEIICCCCCNIVTMVLGIIGCVFTTKANNAYKSGNAQEYKANSKTASICLWIGLGFAVLWLIICIAAGSSDFGKDMEEAFWEGYYGVDDYDSDYDYDSDISDDYDYDYDYDYGDDSEDSEDAEDVADSKDAEEEEPLNVTPGEGFDDPTVIINGVTVTLPMSYSDFKALGFYVETGDEEYIANGGEYYEQYFYDASGEELGYVYIGNVSDSPIALKDGTVFGFRFTSLEYYDDLTLEFTNGLTMDATRDDFMTAFGDPDYSYESEDNDYQSYQWYNHNDLWEDMDMEENSLSVDFWDGELDEVDLMYIGWD